MRWTHPAQPGRVVRLAYCTNLHAGETASAIREGLESVTLPLRDRLSGGEPFGVGLWLPASVVGPALSEDGAAQLHELFDFVLAEGLDPFTFNAFPFGGFHEEGLKERVYAPTWSEPARAEFTLAVARAAADLHARRPVAERSAHVSISTHPGSYGPWVKNPAELHAFSKAMARVVLELARMQQEGGPTIVLSLEAEPRASASDSAALAEFLVVARTRAEMCLVEQGGWDRALAGAAAARHLSACLDCCHSAVEFEDPGRAWRLASLHGGPGKLQFSSALTLTAPAGSASARAALLALDEPRYLHQVTGLGPAGRKTVADLPELAAALESDPDPWLACDEWRCHFHVPVDLTSLSGLGTTRAHADAVLAAALADPVTWSELHLEIETYTWDVLPGEARGAGALV
ncbi:MAG: metabolite traffic protein EboE, partial [Planctomycetota bacterium]